MAKALAVWNRGDISVSDVPGRRDGHISLHLMTAPTSREY